MRRLGRLSRAHFTNGQGTLLPMGRASREAREAVQQALALDPNLGRGPRANRPNPMSSIGMDPERVLPCSTLSRFDSGKFRSRRFRLRQVACSAV